MQGLYIHIPFCIKKCYYCDFISFSGAEEKMSEYVLALNKELTNIAEEAENRTVDSIFIGGGTPSYLYSSLIVSTLEKIRKLFDVSNDAEITIEANPKTFTEEKLVDYRKAGIKRISVGLQSANDESLKVLGRVHNFDDFVKSYSLARDVGFDNINIDLIYDIPSETKDMFFNTIDTVLKIEPEHISLYPLILEEGTPFYEMNEKGLLEFPSEDDEEEMIKYARSKFEEAGYERYEISNYAKKGKRCRHNLNYWHNGYYLAAGLGAHACFKASGKIIRRKNDNTLASYLTGCFSYKNKFIIKEDSMFETVMLGLRLIEGIDLKAFNDRYGISFFDAYKKPIKKLTDQGLLKYDEHRAWLSEHGLDIQNTVLIEFLD